jgi:site-specific DNA-adenine methylase
VLTTKASKISLYGLESKIKSELEPDIAKMYTLIKNNTEEVDRQNKRFEDYTTMMSREIRNAVKKALDKKSR